MKALIVSHYLSPGGLSALIKEQLKTLIANNFKCLLVGPNPVDKELAEVSLVTHIPIPPKVRNLISMTKATAQLNKVTKDFMPDIIIAHGFRACLMVALMPASAIKMFVNHGDLVSGAFRRLTIEALAWRADFAISNFPISSRRWTYMPFLSPHVLKSDPQGLVTANDVQRARGLRVGWFARLDKPKRPDIWLEITQEFVAQVADAEGVIIGNIEASDEHLVRALLDAPKVRTQSWATVKEATTQIDVLVAWSDAEGQLPLAAQEAIWSGVPVVTNRLPGVEAFWGQTTPGMVDDQDGAIQELKKLVDPAARSELLFRQQQKLKDYRKEPDLGALAMKIVDEARLGRGRLR